MPNNQTTQFQKFTESSSKKPEMKLLRKHIAIRQKLSEVLAQGDEPYIDDLFEEMTVEELVLISAKVNNLLNLKINSDTFG